MKKEILKKFDEYGLNYGSDWIDEALDPVIDVITDIAKEHHQSELKKLRLGVVVGSEAELVCDCGNKLTDKEIYFGQCLQCDKNIEEAN